MKEGELASLGARGTATGSEVGHRMVLTKVDGEIIVVNNQGWNTGAAAETFLQTIDEWDATWRSKFPNGVYYHLVRTNLSIPYAP